MVARKPLTGTVAANVSAHGTGALNIDGCRIGDGGRWPANVILDEDAAATLDQQTGTLTSGLLERHHSDHGKPAGTYGAMPGAPGRASYGDSGGASRFFYVAKAGKAERPIGPDGTKHPTVKPLALMRWLVRLVTPPGGTVLDPFLGSGTTAEAAELEGFDWLGCELTPEYVPLITARLRRSTVL